ncbi:metalloregulator ArsR/SmtB family transcription factor [Paracrocinitomix mangrovi]|uniref:ArsR/SmtB family transcription factor n=1 Tax=Paracrocinitomix mangrovi TaxID=2862509 RepID=UPI001C8DE31D|nr:metalloregulator ArsR/SmtB family transcription factor [Paracrocinitomix mangrovi]UKN02555.1 metalloregulator ArsR/SmtB family transcription factor [Paracrocinitomix mangrovi]
MGTTKKELFSERQNKIAGLAKALGHPARIAIIEQMLNSEDCITNDLVNELGLAQATISQHLKALKDEGIIQGTISGVKTCYCINESTWNEISEQFDLLFKSYNGCNSSCKQ